MALSTTSPTFGASRASSIVGWSLLEAALVALAIGVVVPWFAPLAAHPVGRDGRFAAASIAVRGLPDPVLPVLCAAYGALAEDVVAERLCAGLDVSRAGAPVDRMPAVLASANVRARQAFLAPLQEAQARMADLRAQQREGLGDVLALGHDIEAAASEVQPFLARYAIDPSVAEGPRPLACAFDGVQALLTDAPRRASARALVRANAVLSLGAALDGHPATPGAAAAATLPSARPVSGPCTGLALADALAAASTLVADARNAPASLAKNEAMRDLLVSARWQWTGAVLLGWALLALSRRRVGAAAGVALALAAWAIAAWLARVPWPFAGKHGFVLGRDAPALLSPPATYVVVMLATAAGFALLGPWLRRRSARAPQRPASVLAYPGFVLATGIGWVLLLDLSANGHFGNRYLALYHQGHLWLALTTFSLVAFARQPLGGALAWTLSLLDGAAGRVRARIGAAPAATLFLALALSFALAMAVLLANLRQLTSEIGRLWLIVGAAWFFFLRGTPLTERLARTGGSLPSLARYASPLVFVVVVLIAAMVFTRDMGPLLIAGYGAGAFLAACVTMWRQQRTGATLSAYALAVLLFAAWIAATTLALFRLGAIDAVTAARLENAAAPLASANDQLALVTWFQRSAPPSGFGPGAVPWCGFGASSACAGVPAQIQSDYTFTALVGTFGWTVAWAITLGAVAWLYRVVRGHAGATRGEPRLVRVAARLANDEQGFVSWLVVCWVALALCQLAVTVAGNLAVIPLTGVTFPFVSFGMASLVSNAAMLGLAANVNGTGRSAHG